MLVCIAVNYLAGRHLEPDEWGFERDKRRLVLIGAVAFNLAVLTLWKYAGFASAQLVVLARWFGGELPVLELALPVAAFATRWG